MTDNRSDLFLKSLLFYKGRVSPDGRPLFKYKLSSEDFARLSAHISKLGSSIFDTRQGKATIVIFLSEWFRRSREDGGWDWSRPLQDVGLKYTPGSASTSKNTVTYAQIRDAVVNGLQYWKRPAANQEHTKKFVWAVVREAGLPLATIRQDSGMRRWVSKSLQLMETGYTARMAVERCSHNFSISDLKELLSPNVIELCECLLELKQAVKQGGGVALEGPILYLDEHVPDWRDRLPLVAEDEEVAALLKQVFSDRPDTMTPFSVVRRLRLEQGVWTPTIKFQLNCDIPTSGPLGLSIENASISRARVFVRSASLEGGARPIAIIESQQSDRGNHWRSRTLIKNAEFSVPFDEDVTLIIQSNQNSIYEFCPYGSEAQTDEIRVFQKNDGSSDDALVAELTLLPGGSVKSPLGELYLACSAKIVDTFNRDECSTFEEVGACKSGEKIYRFSGSLSLHKDGVRRTWSTGQNDASLSEIIPYGYTFSNLSPTVFRGLPELFLRSGDDLVALPKKQLFWRAIKTRRWVPCAETAPIGEGEVAQIVDGEIKCSLRVRTLPQEFDFEIDYANDGAVLKIKNLAIAGCISNSGESLTITVDDEEFAISIPNARPGTSHRLQLLFQHGALKVSIRNSGLERYLLDQDGNPKHRETLGFGRLNSATLSSGVKSEVIFAISVGTARYDCVRTVVNEVPVGVYKSDIRSLLSLSGQKDAIIKADWVGGGSSFLAIKHYEEDRLNIDFDLAVEQIKNAFRAHGVSELSIVPITAPTNATNVRVEDIQAADRFEDNLEGLAGAGPWFIAARRKNGESIRPFFFGSSRTVPESTLAKALTLSDEAERKYKITQLADCLEGRLSLVDYVRDAINACRRFDIPPHNFDALQLLAENSSYAVQILSTTSPDDLPQLLDVELDLMFQWALTPIQAWKCSFVITANFLQDQINKASKALGPIGIERVLSNLLAIAAYAPELRAHAVLTAKHVFDAQRRDTQAALQEAVLPFRDIFLEINAVNLRHEENSMVVRRVDGNAPPRMNHQNVIGFDIPDYPFPEQFHSILSVPGNAGRFAVNAGLANHELVRCFKQARLFDEDYVQKTFPTHLLAAVNQKTRGRSA